MQAISLNVAKLGAKENVMSTIFTEVTGKIPVDKIPEDKRTPNKILQSEKL